MKKQTDPKSVAKKSLSNPPVPRDPTLASAKSKMTMAMRLGKSLVYPKTEKKRRRPEGF